MRIALLGGVDGNWATMLRSGGHVLTSIWTAGGGQIGEITAVLAAEHHCPVFFHRLCHDDLVVLKQAGTELVVVVGYPWLVPVDPTLPAINIHPSLLPDGRGPAPVQWVLSTHPGAAGVTIHKLTAEADAGDILAQEPMTLTAADDLHTVFARTYWRSAQMMAAILSDFPRAWAAAVPQAGAGRWTADHPEVFTIGAATRVGEALHHWRAFGPGLVAWDGMDQGGPDRNTHRTRWVAAVRGWPESHGLAPGTVVSDDGRITTLAVADGFLLIEADTAG